MQIKTNVILTKWKVSIVNTEGKPEEIIIEAESEESARLKAVSDGFDVEKIEAVD